MVFNGKNTGAAMIVDPFATLNDGLLDATWVSESRVNSLSGISDMLGKAKKKGGIHIYDRTSTYVRGR
jgi:hypothetical protein